MLATANASNFVTASCDGSSPVSVIVDVSKIATTGWGDPSGCITYGVPGATDGLVAGVFEGTEPLAGAPVVVVESDVGTGGRTRATADELIGEESINTDSIGNAS